MAQSQQPTTQKASMTTLPRNTAQSSPRVGIPQKGGQFVMKPYQMSVAVSGMGYAGAPRAAAPVAPRPQAQPQAKPQSELQTNGKKGKKRNRREREYFFVMRKGVCFFMFLVSIVMLAVLAMSFLNIMPEYVSMFVAPDLTPGDERPEPELDADGIAIEGTGYQDQSEYVGVSDGIYGFLDRIMGNKAEEDLEAAEAADDEVADDVVTDDEEGLEEEVELPRSPFYDEISAKLDELTGENAPEIAAEDGKLTIASYLFIYGPIAYLVMAVILVLTAIKAFFGMFGRRIFKRFGLAAIILLVCAIVVLLSGLIGAGVLNGNPKMEAPEEGAEEELVSVMDVNSLMDFVTQAFSGYPETAEAAAESTFLTFRANYGSLILLAVPVVLLVLSFFARRKVPYSIFDR